MKTILLYLACLAILTNASLSHADIVIHADLSPTSPTREVNPTITGEVGSTGTIYLWVELDSSDRLNGVGLDLVADTSGIVKATSHSIDNPNTAFGSQRWPNLSAINPGSLSTAGFDEMFRGSNAVSFGEGIRGSLANPSFDPTFDAAGDSFRYSAVDYEIAGVGCTDIYLETNSSGITTATGGAVPIRFGWGDAAIQNTDFGVRTALPEVVICGTPVPEPNSSVLLLVATGLLCGSRWARVRRQNTRFE